MSNDEIQFAPETPKQAHQDNQPPYHILIVDDEEGVHALTKLALQEMRFDHRALKFLSAYSAKEAITFLQNSEQVAIVLLDIVMESNEAGFDVIKEIREHQNNTLIRIIIRTGQPGQAPERYVIEHFDINEYKEKTELTSDRLYISVRTALKQYEQIKQLQAQTQNLRKSMHTDLLTGLPNRSALLYDLERKTYQWLMLLDIDNFSIYNSAYGFSLGDDILLHYVALLSQFLTRADETTVNIKLYRLEADRFVVLMNGDDVMHCANRLKYAIANEAFILQEVDINLHASIGISAIKEGNALQKAEIALQEARYLNQNRIVIYKDTLISLKNINENFYWTKKVRHALQNQQIIVQYQPIVNCQTLQIVKHECLVRLQDGDEMIAPILFLKSARFAGLLNDITHAVIAIACKQFQYSEHAFSINITDHDLHDDTFVDYLEQQRANNGLKSSQIILEVLEESSINNDTLAQKTLQSLLTLGYAISIDDFGVECSNFAQMGSLPLESIKIDGSFIKMLEHDTNAMTITQTILYLTNQLHIPTVAEHVHNEAVFAIVKRLGVTYAQGHYFSEPKSVPLLSL